MQRNATAIWNGTVKEGKGTLTSQSQILDKTPYTFVSRFDKGKGTNPEELMAAAHAGCFTMQLSAFLTEEGFTPDELSTTSTITLDNGKITKSDLVLSAKIENISNEKFQEIAKKAKENCPVSKAYNLEISLKADLV